MLGFRLYHLQRLVCLSLELSLQEERERVKNIDNLIIDLCKYIHKLSKDKSKANELAANVKALAELIETRNKYEQKGK